MSALTAVGWGTRRRTPSPSERDAADSSTAAMDHAREVLQNHAFTSRCADRAHSSTSSSALLRSQLRLDDEAKDVLEGGLPARRLCERVPLVPPSLVQQCSQAPAVGMTEPSCSTTLAYSASTGATPFTRPSSASSTQATRTEALSASARACPSSPSSAPPAMTPRQIPSRHMQRTSSAPNDIQPSAQMSFFDGVSSLAGRHDSPGSLESTRLVNMLRMSHLETRDPPRLVPLQPEAMRASSLEPRDPSRLSPFRHKPPRMSSFEPKDLPHLRACWNEAAACSRDDKMLAHRLAAMQDELTSLSRASEACTAEMQVLRAQLHAVEQQRAVCMEERAAATQESARRGVECEELRTQLSRSEALARRADLAAEVELQEQRGRSRAMSLACCEARRELGEELAARRSLACSLMQAEQRLSTALAPEPQRMRDGGGKSIVGGAVLDGGLQADLDATLAQLRVAIDQAAAVWPGMDNDPKGEAVASAVEKLTVLAVNTLRHHVVFLQEQHSDIAKAAAMVPVLLKAGRTLSRSTGTVVRRVQRLGCHLASGKRVRCSNITGPNGRAETPIWAGDWVPFNTDLPNAEHAAAVWQLAAADARAVWETVARAQPTDGQMLSPHSKFGASPAQQTSKVESPTQPSETDGQPLELHPSRGSHRMLLAEEEGDGDQYGDQYGGMCPVRVAMQTA